MEGNKDVNVHGHRLDNASLNRIPKVQTTKEKVDKLKH